MVVYKALNIKTGKVYIGQTIDFEKRKLKHIHYALSGSKVCPKFYSAIRKYGPNSFEWSILSICKSRSELNSEEVKFINELDAINNGYNVDRGGHTGVSNLKKSTIKKIKKSNKLKWSDPEFRKKHSEHMKGRVKHSEETKKYLSQINTGKKMSKASSNKKSKAIKALYKNPEFKAKVTKSIQEAFDNKIYQYDMDLNPIRVWPSKHSCKNECSGLRKDKTFAISKGYIWSKKELNKNQDMKMINDYIEYLKTYRTNPSNEWRKEHSNRIKKSLSSKQNKVF